MATTFQQNLPADSVAITATGLASLATSSTRLAGYELDAVSNRSNLDLTHLLSGKIRVGTTPTANKQIDIWMIPASSYASGTPSWPDVFDGTASTETATSAGVLAGCGVLLKSLLVDSNTTDRDYYFSEIDLAAANGGTLPFDYVIFIAHDTGVNLNSTGSNFTLTYTRVRCAGN